MVYLLELAEPFWVLVEQLMDVDAGSVLVKVLLELQECWV